MLKFLSRATSITILSGAIAMTFAIVVFLMAVVLAGEGPVFKVISCQLGFSKECLWVELKEERAALEAARAENKLLQQETQRLSAVRRENETLQRKLGERQAVFDRLTQLDHASSSYVIFYERTARRHTVSTGHTYASLLRPDNLLSAHCYVYAKVSGAGSRRINLGKMNALKKVSYSSYSSASLRGSGLSKNDIPALQKACNWPNVAR